MQRFILRIKHMSVAGMLPRLDSALGFVSGGIISDSI